MGSKNMPEPKDHAQHRNFIESILRHVPGFRGYLEKEYRRDSDALARQWLGERLERSKRSIARWTRPLADAGKIDLLPEVDRLRNRLDKLVARIRGAMRGYSGFFDLVRVREDLLDRIYEHDVALMKEIDALGEAVEELAGQQEAIAHALGKLHDSIDSVEVHWDQREDMLKGLE